MRKSLVIFIALVTLIGLIGLLSLNQYDYSIQKANAGTEEDEEDDRNSEDESDAMEEEATGQQYELYQSDLYGFSIEYPSDWELFEQEVTEFTESIKEDELERPWDASDDVCFFASDRVIEGRYNNNPLMPASLCVVTLSQKAEEYLDTNDMTVKTRLRSEMTPRDMAEGYLTEGSLPGSLVKSEEITFGTGNYSAWKVDTQRNVETPQYGIANDYHVGIYSIVGDKIYRIEYWAIDLVVPEYMPILQKMVDSFHIT